MPPADSTGRCRECQRPTFGGADYCKARLCPHYAPIWARDQTRKCFENLKAYSDGEGHAAMFTPTAPGADVLPWDEQWCAPLGPHKHSGLLGCRVVPEVAREWNRTAPDRWRRLHDRAATLAAKDVGHRPLMLCRSWEKQTRGVLHVHATIGRGLIRDKRACDAYGQHINRLAPRYGFGRVDEPTGRARHARESAAYISSYLTRGKGHKRDLSETVRSDELPRSIIHVSTRLTQTTGVTMRALRFRRLIYCRWGVALPWDEQAGLMRLVEAFPGSTLERPRDG